MKKRARQAENVSGLDFINPNIPTELSNNVDKTFAVAKYISNFVESKDFKQKDIAEKLGKHESEISRWLSGFHNLTLNSIIKLESVSSIKLLNPAIFTNYNSVYFINQTLDSFIEGKPSTIDITTIQTGDVPLYPTGRAA